MGRLHFLIEPSVLIVADASTAINLNATDCAAAILRAFPNRVVVVDVVQQELETGGPRGRENAARLNELVAANLVEIVTLADTGAGYFERLVVGTAAETLDDGEAATIAYAVEQQAVALIDERKANRICRERFPGLSLGTTVDLLAHADVAQALGPGRLSQALISALQVAHMRVLPQHVDWVVSVIGREQASECLSLPRSARQPKVLRPDV